jgi:hypothetical protein
MKVEDSHLIDDIIVKMEETLGNLYFLENLLIIEFSEGTHISLESSKNVISKIQTFYHNKSFGVICNRVSPYSIVPQEVPEFKTIFKTLNAYAVVGYTKASLMNAVIENNFCKSDEIVFNDLIDAVKWVDSKLKIAS